MKPALLFYTRRDCCLCQETKAVIQQVAARIPLVIDEVDVDTASDLQEQYGSEVPVLFINGRKAFKYRLSRRELERKLK